MARKVRLKNKSISCNLLLRSVSIDDLSKTCASKPTLCTLSRVLFLSLSAEMIFSEKASSLLPRQSISLGGSVTDHMAEGEESEGTVANRVVAPLHAWFVLGAGVTEPVGKMPKCRRTHTHTCIGPLCIWRQHYMSSVTRDRVKQLM